MKSSRKDRRIPGPRQIEKILLWESPKSHHATIQMFLPHLPKNAPIPFKPGLLNIPALPNGSSGIPPRGPKVRQRKCREIPVKRRTKNLPDFMTKLSAIKCKNRINRSKSAQAGNPPFPACVMKSWFSPKTLKSYSMWLRKFQTFTKSKSLESINDENYKAFLTFLAVEKRLEVRLILILKTPGSFRLRIPNPDEPEP